MARAVTAMTWVADASLVLKMPRNLGGIVLKCIHAMVFGSVVCIPCRFVAETTSTTYWSNGKVSKRVKGEKRAKGGKGGKGGKGAGSWIVSYDGDDNPYW